MVPKHVLRKPPRKISQENKVGKTLVDPVIVFCPPNAPISPTTDKNPKNIEISIISYNSLLIPLLIPLRGHGHGQGPGPDMGKNSLRGRMKFGSPGRTIMHKQVRHGSRQAHTRHGATGCRNLLHALPPIISMILGIRLLEIR